MNIPSGTCTLGKKGCFTDGKCYYNRNCENKVVTNADLVRAMSDDELAAWLAAKFSDLQAQRLFGESSTPTATQLSALSHTLYCQWMYWLKQPAKDGADE